MAGDVCGARKDKRMRRGNDVTPERNSSGKASAFPYFPLFARVVDLKSAGDAVREGGRGEAFVLGLLRSGEQTLRANADFQFTVYIYINIMEERENFMTVYTVIIFKCIIFAFV